MKGSTEVFKFSYARGHVIKQLVGLHLFLNFILSVLRCAEAFLFMPLPAVLIPLLLFLFFFSLLEVLVQISLHTWKNNLGHKETEPLVGFSVLRVILVHHPFMMNVMLSAFESIELKMPD